MSKSTQAEKTQGEQIKVVKVYLAQVKAQYLPKVRVVDLLFTDKVRCPPLFIKPSCVKEKIQAFQKTKDLIQEIGCLKYHWKD